ncbi:DUF4082 domain-containing protein [Pseudolysinimonas sp.]|uniref:DUF4082 domain-containing protein n=1 Tax=Pseudolysinimonas sp. TaxID=2680009 RepID=UPI003F7F387D
MSRTRIASGLSRIRLSVIIAAVVAVAAFAWIALVPTGQAAGATRSVFTDSIRPTTLTDPDRRPVELGVRFSTKKEVTVTGVRFYKGPRNTGTHVGSLWSPGGIRIATTTFTHESRSGWQSASFSRPIRVEAGRTYVLSYSAPKGRYSSDAEGFRNPISDGTVTYPRGAGVYSYVVGAYPQRSYRNSNYLVDVVYRATRPTDPSASPGSPTPTPSATPTASAPPVTAPDGPVAAPGGALALNLGRIPWEGGPAYWSKFPAAAAAGWTDPSFFPIGIWYNQIDTDAQVAWDKQAGINTYIGLWEGTPSSIFDRNGVYWAGGPLNSTYTNTTRNWVGNFLDDEVDGRFDLSDDGLASLRSDLDRVKGNGRFNYANFTQMVISGDFPLSQSQKYVNDFTDVVSLDQYFYTNAYCGYTPYRDPYLVSIQKNQCRSSSSYGNAVRALRIQDAADGRLQPVWQFVEDLNGSDARSFQAYITPDQLKGAVMSSLIAEARGVVYFNQSLSGPCQSAAVLRDAQNSGPGFCGAAQVAAMTQVDAQIRALAPVLNTQSYDWTFGPGLQTMLKTYGGSAYVFAMTDGSTGSRTFALPPQLKRSTVEVLSEGRSVAVSAAGTFTDSFPTESTYHVYKVTPHN